MLIDEAGRNRRWLDAGGMSELPVNGLGEHCELFLNALLWLPECCMFIIHCFWWVSKLWGTLLEEARGVSPISSCLFAQVLQHNAGNGTGKLRVTFPIR